MFGKKKLPAVTPYDKTAETPAIRTSICTGEQVAGFKSNANGRFREVMLLKTPADLQEFLRQYAVNENDLRQEW